MKKIDLRGVKPLEPKHLVRAERGLVIVCPEMKHSEEDLYTCTDGDACGITYQHLQFVGYATREPRGDVDRMYPPEVDHAPMKCTPRCILLKRNSECNFICVQCGGYWYMEPGQKFLMALDDLHIQDPRVIKFMLLKLRESVEQSKKLSGVYAEKLESLLADLLQRYEL